MQDRYAAHITIICSRMQHVLRLKLIRYPKTSKYCRSSCSQLLIPTLSAKSWYLNKGYHALPTGLNAMKNLHLRNAGSKHHITAAAQVRYTLLTKTWPLVTQ